MTETSKRIPARFYKNELEKEPVRDWLKDLPKEDRTLIGVDIKTIEYGWPIGMPTCKALRKGLFEVRTNLTQNRIARVIFCIHGENMILLHAFIKKTQKMPKDDMNLALKRKKELEKSE